MRALYELLNHKRFWLFAPFVGLLALVLLTYGLWNIAATRISDQLASQGLSWQSLDRQGYPARITLDMQAPRLRRDGFLWQNSRTTATLMPFNHRHAVFDFRGAHYFEGLQNETGKNKASLAHDGNLMSLVHDADGIVRGSFEAQAPRLSGQWNNTPFDMQAQVLGVHLQRQDDTRRLNAALVLKQLRLANNQAIARFDVLSEIPRRWIQNAPQANDRIKLQRVTIERGALTVIARGSLKLATDGFLEGKLDMDFLSQTALLDALEEFGLLEKSQRRRAAFLFGLGAALGGDTQDRLSVPLVLRNGRVLLGPLNVAQAPRWR